MPGPVALKKKEYYGFAGNHFWPIMRALFGWPADLPYKERLKRLGEERVALWDTIRSCRRSGALDSAITGIVPNDITGLVTRCEGIRTIFLNGKTAEKLYRKHFGGKLHLAAYYLPSTSPANASISFEKKLKAWEAIKPFLANRNPWC